MLQSLKVSEQWQNHGGRGSSPWAAEIWNAQVCDAKAAEGYADSKIMAVPDTQI